MRRSLYLHEIVDVVGQGQYEYMEHLRKDPVEQMPEMFTRHEHPCADPLPAVPRRRTRAGGRG